MLKFLYTYAYIDNNLKVIKIEDSFEGTLAFSHGTMFKTASEGPSL